MNNKVKWLDRALFVTPHYFCLCLSESQFHAALNHMRIPKNKRLDFMLNWHSDATTHYLENKGSREVSAVVCLQNHEGKAGTQIAALLVHEAVHIWQETCRLYGEHEPSQELEAYAIQTISQRLMESYEMQVAR